MSKKALRVVTTFTPEPEGGFTVTFPDFPGCITYGKTLEEARKYAHEVLELWLEEMVSRKESVFLNTFTPMIGEIMVMPPRGLRMSVDT